MSLSHRPSLRAARIGIVNSLRLSSIQRVTNQSFVVGRGSMNHPMDGYRCAVTDDVFGLSDRPSRGDGGEADDTVRKKAGEMVQSRHSSGKSDHPPETSHPGSRAPRSRPETADTSATGCRRRRSDPIGGRWGHSTVAADPSPMGDGHSLHRSSHPGPSLRT